MKDGLIVDAERLGDGAIAGLIAGTAFAATMKLDMALSGEPVDDFLLLGGIGPWRRYWRVTGPIIHGINSAVVGAVYSVVEPRLPGPGWLRGLIFALVENTLLWPVLLVLDRIHPAVRSGRLPRYNQLWPFTAETLRHVVYGLVLGWVYGRGRRKL